ncbi:MAG: GYDIA family GHMP kinase [Bacteroidota bacterium]
MEASPLFLCRANGKLLLTGEYLVLDGALALAVPTRYGQTLEIYPTNAENTLHWQSIDHEGNCWFEAWFSRSDYSISQTSDPRTAVRLLQLLNACRVLNPDFLTEKIDLRVVTKLDFPNNWGLGTSSTLVHCLSKWAGIDQFKLLEKTFGGSGYDLACASANGPVFYQIGEKGPGWTVATLSPGFKNQIYFVFLEQKQNSREGIKHYRELGTPKKDLIETVSAYAKAMDTANSLSEFNHIINKHESVLANVLKITPVKQKSFPDYWGSIKSLGAWGGDFVMVTSERSKEETEAYFKNKGYQTILSYTEMVLSEPAAV